ncbi:MAG: SsrA-binding protein [Candidatus Komeilibacteria bacterium CG11_big_fil_rev_8_21_14_0_20_36_20]|uniref:SsrA-binding protein n=1 Tax=Candidatus Komeilibacteria bacterium CG11_big_fil_rev_8_21_14_0_20_36_20 TaxID=1974477 RepID=A0A2H0NDC0_9BACT|nr:MAG: SsrA-binding protein [Candidatus Komeilibacteria bacterium CG11_big_fil_rev_8_21_14_0_20_36_20]PIR81604.1 MAG: SsrA-binding protein [Candidatus Komeilibacteria bacterium CG10_big_fil_rev_8_21_14_0_10_36_65]PJC55442.1 MAG: SsrA-binding protein [Candidatus Komeilibacteria bacterium CG_4_9_14_0_2_um_filter_36_13]
MSTLAINKKAKFNFQLLEEFEAGLVLTGQEVKSAKLGRMDLKGAFVSIKNGQVWIKKLYIAPYHKAGHSLKNYEAEHDRKLLLKDKEIIYLTSKTQQKGLTIIPISVYTSRRIIKVKIALVKGKKKFDKRETIKKRDIERVMARKIKSF